MKKKKKTTRRTPPQVRLWRAALDTSHFDFEAYGTTPAAAKAALRRAWREHVAQTGAEPHLIEQDVRDLTPYPVQAGWGFRDREPIVGGDEAAAAPEQLAEDAPEALDDEQVCERVAVALSAAGFPAEAQYTGGGIWCVSIAEPTWPDAAWLCGMSAEHWGGTLMEADSYAPYDDPTDAELMHTLDTTVSSDSQATCVIAAALANSIRAWRTAHATSAR